MGAEIMGQIRDDLQGQADSKGGIKGLSIASIGIITTIR